MIPAVSTGLLNKVLILAFEESKSSGTGGIPAAKRVFRARVNPEKYTLNYQVKHACSPTASGDVGEKLRHFYTPPEDLTLEFLFDGTGVIDGVGGPLGEVGLVAELEYFKNVLVGYQGNPHSNYYLVVIWGTLIFNCCATNLKIDYKLFNASGIPIRAVANVTFKQNSESGLNLAKLGKLSPDLTHIVRVKAGDTLPLLCQKIYGDSKYYFQVAAANGLANFRRLEPGMDLIFPPIDKTSN